MYFIGINLYEISNDEMPFKTQQENENQELSNQENDGFINSFFKSNKSQKNESQNPLRTDIYSHQEIFTSNTIHQLPVSNDLKLTIANNYSLSKNSSFNSPNNQNAATSNQMLQYSGGVGSVIKDMPTTLSVSNFNTATASLEEFTSNINEAVSLGAAFSESVATNDEDEDPGGPGDIVSDTVPIDGGLCVLLVAALGKGITTYKRRKKTVNAILC